MINNLPTVYEVVTGAAKKQSKAPNGSSKSSKSNSKVSKHYFCVQLKSKYMHGALHALHLANSFQCNHYIAFCFSHRNRPTLTASLRSPLTQKRTRIVARRTQRRTRHTFVAPVGRATRMVSSGSAVMYVRSGSMESVSALPPPRRSTSSSTSAPAAAASGAENDQAPSSLLMDMFRILR